MQVKRAPEEKQYSCVGCVYRQPAGGCAHPEGEQGFACNMTRSIYKALNKHKEEYRAKVRPINEAMYRADDPATSKGKRKVNKYEQAVLSSLTTFAKGFCQAGTQHGLTGKDMASMSQMPLNCITPRFAPLRRKGLIKDSGVRRDKQIVWALA